MLITFFVSLLKPHFKNENQVSKTDSIIIDCFGFRNFEFLNWGFVVGVCILICRCLKPFKTLLMKNAMWLS